MLILCPGNDCPSKRAWPAAARRRAPALGPYLWVLPAVGVLAFFLFYPIGFSSLLSLFEWDGFRPNAFADFAGLRNFAELLQDKFFLITLKNTLLFVAVMITVELAMAFLLAIFIYLGEFRGASTLRAVIFFPAVLSPVVIGIIWRNVMFLRDGLIHRVSTALGLPEYFPLSDPKLAFFVIVAVAVWASIGYNLVIFYAGLQSLDKEVVESAQIDGAGFWRLITRIIAPLQVNVILLSLILNVIGGVKFFDLAYVMSGRFRSPLVATHVTDVLASYMVFNSYRGGASGGVTRMGYAAAIAVVMMLLMLAVALLRARLRRSLEP